MPYLNLTMAKRKCDLLKASRKRLKSKIQPVASADLQSSQLEDEVEIGWDSPKPVSGLQSDPTVADIVAQLATSNSIPVLTPPLQLQYASPQTNNETVSTPPKAPAFGLRRQSKAKLSFNQAIIEKVMAVINEYKPQAGEVQQTLTSADQQQQVNRLHGEDHLKVTKPNVSSSINQSNDDLWTDEDESLIRATQAFLDVTPKATRVTTVGRLELSKDVHVSPAVSSCSTLTTSTPNICSRVSRVTFGLEPASADAGQKFNGQSKHAKVTLPSASRSRASFAIAAENSCKEFLAKLTEPNVVLNTQASDGNGGDGVKSPGNKRSAEVTDHASFIDDNDPLESPELAAVLEEVEYRATQSSSGFQLSALTADETFAHRSSVNTVVKSNSCTKSNCSSTINKQSKPAKASAPVKRLCSAEEIERKRQEALKRRSKTLVRLCS